MCKRFSWLSGSLTTFRWLSKNCRWVLPVRSSRPKILHFTIFQKYVIRKNTKTTLYFLSAKNTNLFVPECIAKGSRLTLGGSGGGALFVTRWFYVRNRLQPFATVRGRALRRCHWGKLLQVTIHGCVTCQFAPLFHCDLHEHDMSRKKRDAFRCTGAAFCEICRQLCSSIGISVWRVVFLGCWMWPCHWDFAFQGVASKLGFRDKSQLKWRFWWMGVCSERVRKKKVWCKFC